MQWFRERKNKMPKTIIENNREEIEQLLKTMTLKAVADKFNLNPATLGNHVNNRVSGSKPVKKKRKIIEKATPKEFKPPKGWSRAFKAFNLAAGIK